MASLLISNSTPGQRQYLLTSEHSDAMALRTEFEAAPILAYAEWMRHRMEAAKAVCPEGRPLGVIPSPIYYKNKMWQWTDAEIEKWFRDPENALLRFK